MNPEDSLGNIEAITNGAQCHHEHLNGEIPFEALARLPRSGVA